MYTPTTYQQPSYYQPTPIRPMSYANTQPFNGLKGRPVSSLEEARAQTIDFDGSVFLFPDFANGKIYTKQINMDGTASLNVYELTELPKVPNGDTSDFVTHKELEQVIASFKEAITPKVKAEETKFKTNF